jgi:hypothetical protein
MGIVNYCIFLPHVFRFPIVVVIFIFLTYESEARLPPGYEDELYCPDAMFCLIPVHHVKGWSGARTQMFKCFKSSNNTYSHVVGWGNQVEEAFKDKLIQEGWSEARECTNIEKIPLVKGLFISSLTL